MPVIHLLSDFMERVWAAAREHDAAHHQDRELNIDNWRVDFEESSLRCKSCRAEVPVDLTKMEEIWYDHYSRSVSYTHLTLPTKA